MTYIKTNISEVDADFNFIFSNKLMLVYLSRNLNHLYCYSRLEKELRVAFPNLSLFKFDIAIWLLFLLKNNKLHLLFLAMYFRPPGSKLEFDLSSFSKIRNSK